MPQNPRLLDQLRGAIRIRHYSLRTEDVYVAWVRRFILFHGKRHPMEMGAHEVETFLSHLAQERQVSAATQNQAKAAILFLYKHVLNIELPWLDEVVQAKNSPRLPVVLTLSEVRQLLDQMKGTSGLVARLLFGSGMRLLEGLRLRVKDLDFGRHEVIVREGKGNKDRVTMLPESLESVLKLVGTSGFEPGSLALTTTALAAHGNPLCGPLSTHACFAFPTCAPLPLGGPKPRAEMGKGSTKRGAPFLGLVGTSGFEPPTPTVSR